MLGTRDGDQKERGRVGILPSVDGRVGTKAAVLVGREEKAEEIKGEVTLAQLTATEGGGAALFRRVFYLARRRWQCHPRRLGIEDGEERGGTA